MEEKLYFTQKDGKPALCMNLNGAEITVNFADKESEIDIKKGVLRLIMQSYEDRVLGKKQKPELV